MPNVSQEAIEVIERVLRERMAPVPVREIAVHSGEDHDGDDVLVVEVHYELSHEPVDLGATSGMVSSIRDALWELGENRFPHIKHHFHAEQAFLERKRSRPKRTRQAT